jgi:hypothetical protein
VFSNWWFIQTYPEFAFISISFVQLFIPELVKIVCFIYCTAFQIFALIKVNPSGIVRACVIDKTENHIHINMMHFLKNQMFFVVFAFFILTI